MENHGDRPEIKDAFEKGLGSSTRFSNTLNMTMMYLAIPIRKQGETVAIVRTSLPITAIDERLSDINNKIVLVALTIAILAALLSLFISSRISKPIEQMKNTAQSFASGRLDLRVQIPKSVELEGLAKSLNEMAEQLHDRIETITRQRNESDAILSSMVEGVLAVDSNGHVVSINKAASNFLGLEVDNVLGLNIEEVVRNPDFQRFVQDTLKEQAPRESEIFLPGPPDRYFSLHGACLTDSTDSRSGAVIVLTDTTRMKRLEDIRRDFVANVSHELKTPITSIKGFIETLLEGAMNEPKEAERFLKVIATHSDRLNAIVEDLLSLSRLEEASEERKLTFNNSALKPVLDSVIELSKIKAEQKRISIVIECEPNLKASINTVLLEQAILNLVDNAIKYSEKEGKVHIKAWETDGMVAVSVQDKGCGISVKHHRRIFERFYVVDKSRSRKLGGTGLGLAIVKHISQVHGGYVTVESTVSKGSTFTIYLPNE
jgi:two-component system phosphate regulon sensor histidine kinase PhoR